jgi:hypothetical protein
MFGLRSFATSIDTSECEFDILQVVCMDRPVDHVRVIGTKEDDRLCQVEVGIPSEDILNYELPDAMVAYVRNAIKVAVLKVDLPDKVRSELIRRIQRLEARMGHKPT